MAKRFTDTEKWTKNKWFRLLPTPYKLFWLFILDNCDCVGVWEEDIEFFCNLTGEKITKQEALVIFENQIMVMATGKKWWVIDFVMFQYGELKEENIKNKPHQKYISELKSHRLWIDYTKTIHSPQEKEKEEEEEKEKEKEKEKDRPKKQKPEIEIIYPFDTGSFKEQWSLWVKFKKEQFKFTYQPIGEQAALKELAELSAGSEETAIAIIHQSISNGWKGLFQLKTNANGTKQVTAATAEEFNQGIRDRIAWRSQRHPQS